MVSMWCTRMYRTFVMYENDTHEKGDAGNLQGAEGTS